MRKLLVLAGAADPATPQAQGRYKLVVEEALIRGYEAPQVVAWGGQDSAGGGAMELASASSQLTKLFRAFELEETPYDVIAFSWGASVYLNTLSKMEAPTHLRNTVLWGIDEFWRLSEYFLNEENMRAITGVLRDAGTNLSADFYARQVPNEVLLRHYPHSNPIRIGFGERDNESPPAFAAYLKSFVKKHNITYRVVPEVGHIVQDQDKEYIDCLFGF
jgi:pimeloyl-ACP methyl ester carboxylesterase